MKAQDYRRQVEEALGRRPQETAAAAGPAKAEPEWPALIATVADPAADAEARRTAIHALQAAAFLGARFAACRADFVAALRAAATDPASESLRHSALDALANMKDSFARERLVRGLENAGEALVPPAVALGLLARDDHVSASSLARRFLESGAGRHIKEQAVRLLGPDPTARPILERLLQDKNEFREVRRASAVALQHLDADAFVEKARRILDDPGEFDDIRRTVRAALERRGIPVPPLRGAGEDRGNLVARTLRRLRRLFGDRTRR